MPMKNKKARCKCPKCGVVHKLNLEWTGSGTCRKYCSNCKNSLSVVDDAEGHRVMVESV